MLDRLIGDPAGFLQTLVLMAPALLLAVTVHEVAHGFVADLLGDPTARLQGRLTLNPLPHIDPLGALAFVIAGFGWAKPVPVNASAEPPLAATEVGETEVSVGVGTVSAGTCCTTARFQSGDLMSA